MFIYANQTINSYPRIVKTFKCMVSVRIASVTKDFYSKITDFIKKSKVKP